MAVLGEGSQHRGSTSLRQVRQVRRGVPGKSPGACRAQPRGAAHRTRETGECGKPGTLARTGRWGTNGHVELPETRRVTAHVADTWRYGIGCTACTIHPTAVLSASHVLHSVVRFE